MEEFNNSLNFDRILWKEELQASAAYAAALMQAGILTKGENAGIVKALLSMSSEFETGKFKFKPDDEDIHTAVERRLVEKIGDSGKKLHTGRSRNEQVATDERLFIRNANGRTIELITGLQTAIKDLAEKTLDDIVPSYTHLQQAQLIRLGHYFMSFFFMLENDRRRFVDFTKRNDVLPLGSGAVAGSTVALDRNILRQQLGFNDLTPNSISAVSDRDFITEYLFCASQTIVHLSRFAEDIILWSSSEFKFVELDDTYATGSSMMPQKKNPDSLELVRGKASRVISSLNLLLTLQKGLPLTYSKDLQEDKEPLFDSIETLLSTLMVFTGVISTLRIRRENLLKNVDDSIYATDIADYLVDNGVPFREAHKIVGKLVLMGIEGNRNLRDFSLIELRKLSKCFDKDYAGIFDPQRSVERHDVIGGTNRKRLKDQIALAGKLLDAK